MSDLCSRPTRTAKGRAPDKHASDQILVVVARALGHPARLHILRLLDREDLCVCGGIVDSLPLSQSTVSQHLKVLREAGLVRCDALGSHTCYRLRRSTLRRFEALVGGLLADNRGHQLARSRPIKKSYQEPP